MNYTRRVPKHKRFDVRFAPITVKFLMAMLGFADSTKTSTESFMILLMA